MKPRLFLKTIKAFLVTSIVLSGISVSAQEIIYQEGFNDDGDGTRYTVEGRGLEGIGQTGPGYWEHSHIVTGFEYDLAGETISSIVGVQATAPARRAQMIWDHDLDGNLITAEGYNLVDKVVAWLLDNPDTPEVEVVASARIFFAPEFQPGDQALIDYLVGKGHTIVEDTGGPLPATSEVDLVIYSSTEVADPQGLRYTNWGVPLWTYSGRNSVNTLTAGAGGARGDYTPDDLISVLDPPHPSTGDISEPFAFVNDTETLLAFNEGGLQENLPPEATIAAFIPQVIPAAVDSLEEVDQMLSGALGSTKSDPSVIFVADLDAGVEGSWEVGPEEVPGTPIGGYATVATGKLVVRLEGTYSFALGADDGARLQINLGDGMVDVVAVTNGGSFSNAFGQATFPSTGEYDFQWVAYNSSDAFGAELSVSFDPDPEGVLGEPVDFDNWERLGDQTDDANVGLVGGEVNVEVYVPDKDPIVNKIPVLVVIEKGNPLLGGPITGFEGTGFFAGAGLNKFPGDLPRVLTLNPIDVSGVGGDLKLSIALAGIRISFDPGDFLEIEIDPDGDGPAEFTLIAAVRGFNAGPVVHYPDPAVPGDLQANPEYDLKTEFSDSTFDLPDDATTLVVRFKALTTWYDEVLAFDNVRVVSVAGGGSQPGERMAIALDGAEVVLTWTGDMGKLQATVDPTSGGWNEVAGATSPHRLTPDTEMMYYRVEFPE